MNILIVRIGAMGDVLHALPAVSAWRAANPSSQVGWAIEPKWSSLLYSPNPPPGAPAMPLVDRIHQVPTSAWKRRPFSLATLDEIRSLRRELRAQHYDACIDLQGSIRSAVVARLASPVRFIGSANPRERPARLIYRERIVTHTTHVIAQAADLMATIGNSQPNTLGNLPFHSPADLLPIDIRAELWASSQINLSAHNDPVGQATKGLVLIAPTAGWGAKQWPAERFGNVAAHLAAGGYQVLINASSASEPIVQQVLASATSPKFSAPPSASKGSIRILPSSLSQLTSLLRRAALVIGGDTGPIHLAAALGRPVLALFGPTDPARNGPVSPDPSSVRVLRHPASTSDHHRRPAPEAGLLRITVEEVLAAAHALLP